MLRTRHYIDLHKGLTSFAVLSLMWVFDCWTTTAWVYLALHGTYGLTWLYKSCVFPDGQWEKKVTLKTFLVGSTFLSMYWLSPLFITKNHVETSGPFICATVVLYAIGMVAQFGSHAQKYFVLKERKGLITDGFFARTRNPNYLGEILIYVSFAMLSKHLLPFLFLAFAVWVTFVPNMYKKDASLSRYPQFQAYKQKTNMILPKLWGRPSPISSTTDKEMK